MICTKEINIVVLCITFFLSGCNSFYHDLEVSSAVDSLTSDITISYSQQSKQMRLSQLGRFGGSTYGYFSDQLPERIDVSWTTESGRKVHKTLIPPDNFDSIITPDNDGIVILFTQADSCSIAYDKELDGFFGFTEIIGESPQIRAQRLRSVNFLNKIMVGDFEYVKKEVAAEIRLNYMMVRSSMTPLSASLHFSSTKNMDITKYLLDHGAKPGGEMRWLASDGNIEALKLLHKFGGDVNYYLNGSGAYSPIIAAIDRGHINTVKWLVENGADVNKPIYNNLTPIYAAALNNELKIARYLLSKGANPNVSMSGRTWLPIDIARERNYTEMVELLSQENK